MIWRVYQKEPHKVIVFQFNDSKMLKSMNKVKSPVIIAGVNDIPQLLCYEKR